MDRQHHGICGSSSRARAELEVVEYGKILEFPGDFFSLSLPVVLARVMGCNPLTKEWSFLRLVIIIIFRSVPSRGAIRSIVKAVSCKHAFPKAVYIISLSSRSGIPSGPGVLSLLALLRAVLIFEGSWG